MAKPYFSTRVIRSAHFGPDSVLPSIFPQKNVQTDKRRDLDEYDEVFYDVGRIPNIMPYAMKCRYDRAEEPTEIETVVLENACLRAEFIPSLGGKLWSLYDKAERRELLYVNDVLRPCNLALCNAWTSGGVEWNIGMIGHTPFACAPMNVAFVEWQGVTALRMYAYERIREVVYQMDFLLPDDSRALLCRMRIKNINDHTVPMYWFSNIAVPQTTRSRVIVPADSAYVSDINGIGKSQVPCNAEGIDVTYPAHCRAATDYFYKIADGQRKYEACVDETGRGMFQTSTSRQRGRKLFAWGSAPGGRNWQRWLTDKAGPYIEIQAGVNQTQYECIPMPPNAAWEWMEAYGGLRLSPETAMGNYADAQAAAEGAIAEKVDAAYLEDLLVRTRPLAHVAAPPLQLAAPGAWATLERMARGAEFEPHLGFAALGEAQLPWKTLLEEATLPAPERLEDVSYMISDAWLKRLEEAEPSPYTDYQIGLNLMYRGDTRYFARLTRAAEAVPLALYALAVAYHLERNERGAQLALEAFPALGGYLEFDRELMIILNDAGRHQAALDVLAAMKPEARRDGHVRCEEARALARLGRLNEAEAILTEGGALQVFDQREGMEWLSDLWFYIQSKRTEKGERAQLHLPEALDFRMA